jgi:eukaryotic-like serine/threonine-protein kinase
MGVVYRAHDEHLVREVAIKVLPLGILADDSSRRRFRNEALTLSGLNHPNIATIYDFDTQQGLDFLVMEYIPGVTLSDSLANASLPEKCVATLGLQLAEGLSAAQEHGVVHRDLKPGNLRLSIEGRLEILDFGLAKLRLSATVGAASETVSEVHSMEGTLPYMAPEQVVGGAIDAHTDIHATGAVLYGSRAVNERDFAARASAGGIGESQVSSELSRIIAKCLEKEPENRYQTAKDLGIDLRRLGILEGVSSTRDEACGSQKGLSSTSRGRLKMAIALIVVLAIAAGFAWRKFFYRSSSATATASIAVLPFADLSPNHDQEYFSDGLTEEILNSLAKIPNLKVVGRTSSFQFKGRNEDLRSVGQKLNVSNVLEGSVRKDGGHLRITVQLIKTSDGFHLWSDSYDRNVSDVFALQDSIAAAIAAALQLQLTAGRTGILQQSVETTRPEAFQAFLQARYFSRLCNPDSSKKALEYATRAIELDPSYARVRTAG